MKKSKESVDEFMDKLDHPFKADVNAMRDIIKRVNPGIGEQIKWKAPSYFYNGADFVTFNLWATERIHLVFHHPAIASIKSDMLHGDYPDRRMSYFADLNEVKAKQAELERVIGELLKAIDG